MTTKHLYRITATYPDGRVWRRDYQSMRSARERRTRLLAEVTVVEVAITVSDPVTWPGGAQ